MQDAVARAGFKTLNVAYRSRRKRLEALVDDIHPAIEEFCRSFEGPLNFVGHSMGGLLVRAYIARKRPQFLGRVVLLGTPNGGSEIADLLKNNPLYNLFFGPAGQQLGTVRDALTAAVLPPVDYPVGIIAGDRTLDPISSTYILPGLNDGRVSVESTKVAGMTDHIVIHASHTWLVRNREAIAQTICFLHDGKFDRNRPP